MADFSIDELITPLSVEELKTSFYNALAVVGVTTTTWKPGAVTRTIIAVVCVVLHALSVLVSNIAKSGFLELSAGLWRRLVARYVYGVRYNAATFAAGTAYVSNSSGFVYSLDPDDLELACSVSGATYRNTAAVSIGAGAANVAVAVQAVEAGSASSALPGELDTVVSSYNGLSVTNTEALVGLDDETDDALAQRCGEKLGSFSPNGPVDAYAHAAKSALRENGSAIGVNRVLAIPDGFGGVDVYVASPGGALATPDLELVDEAIQTQAAPLGITARVHNASPKTINVAYQCWAYNTTGLKESEIRDAVEAALLAYMAAVNIGGNRIEASSGAVYHDDIRAEISRAKYKGASLRIFRTLLDTPAGDTPIGAHEFPTLGTVSSTIVRVAPSGGNL